MPVYEYRCERGHTFEVTQRMTDDPLTSCPTCGASVQRVFHPVAVHFKGSGFYTTDYGGSRGGGSSDSKGGDSSSSDSKPASKEPAKAESSSSSSSRRGSPAWTTRRS